MNQTIKQPKPKVLRINGLRGRVLVLPAAKSRTKELLLLPGLHSSIESLRPLADALSNHGKVTVLDLPGIGGMSSFHSIGEHPTIDNYAAYLASVIELKYHRKRYITVVAIGEGMAILTKLLQAHSKVATKIDRIVSIGGILHHNEIPTVRSNRILKKLGYKIMSSRITSWLASRFTFKTVVKATHSLKKYPASIRNQDAELWQSCDMRTRMYVKKQLMSFDACQKPVHKKIGFIRADMPKNIDNQVLIQHSDIVFSKVSVFEPKLPIQGWWDLTDEQKLKQFDAKLRTWL